MLGLAKYLIGKGEDTEGHVQEALRLSPLDSFAYLWMLFAGVAKIQADEFDDATMWLKRSIDTNTNSPWAHFHLGVALYLMDRLPEARTAVQAGLRLDPSFTTERYRSFAVINDQRYRTIRERTIHALKTSGVP
jgi:tetratricopeptide (TPR) repeat protein